MMAKRMIAQVRERREEQKEACKYVVSICDLCCRSTPDVEDEDYKVLSVEECPEVFCEGYREKIRRGQTGERPGWMTSCTMFAPDIQRIRSVMAHMALDNSKGLAALDALLKG